MPRAKLLPAKWHIIFLLIALVVMVIDQLSKWWIQSFLYVGQSVPEIGFFRFTYAQNTGAAFSIFYGQVEILTIISCLGVILILAYNFFIAHRYSFLNTPINKIALGLVLGGTAGNLIDRVSLGFVRDFIDIGPWPIFNVADSAVVVGVIVFAVFVILESRDSSPERPT